MRASTIDLTGLSAESILSIGKSASNGQNALGANLVRGSRSGLAFGLRLAHSLSCSGRDATCLADKTTDNQQLLRRKVWWGRWLMVSKVCLHQHQKALSRQKMLLSIRHNLLLWGIIRRSNIKFFTTWGCNTIFSHYCTFSIFQPLVEGLVWPGI